MKIFCIKLLKEKCFVSVFKCSSIVRLLIKNYICRKLGVCNNYNEWFCYR